MRPISIGWFVTVLGLAFGSGLFALGLAGLALALVTLHLLPRLEKRIQSDWYVKLSVTADLGGLGNEELRRKIEDLGPKVLAAKINYDVEKRRRTLAYELKLKRSERFDSSSRVVNAISQLAGVQQVAWE